MSTNRKPPRRNGFRRLDEEAIGEFLHALTNGARIDVAARSAGFAASTFIRLKKRDPAFALAWEEAMELSTRHRYIAPANGRRLQLRKTRCTPFSDWRKQVFLARFAATCDQREAAAAAGVHESTVDRHRAIDPVFAGAWQRALELGYARLEAELLRQRLEAQRRLSEEPEPGGELTVEFERALKLLQRWERRNGTLGPRRERPGRRLAWTFEEAIAELDRQLDALETRAQLPPPAADWDGQGLDGEGI
jgi:hypothetical protein